MPASIPTALQKQAEQLKAMSEGNPGPAMTVHAVKEVSAPTMTQAQPVIAQTTPPPAANPSVLDRQDHEQDDVWKHKYDVVNGMLRKTSEENKALKVQIEEIKTRQAATPSANVKPDDITDEDIEAEVTPNLLEEYGYDYWRQMIAMQRKAAQAVKPKQDDPELQNIKQKFQKQEEDRFFDDLDKLVPEWETIHKTKEFQDFLGTVDEMTDVTYKGILQDARDYLNAQRAAAIFRAFLSKSPRTDGFRNLVTPQTRPVQGEVKGNTMTFAEWSHRVNTLNSKGFSPMEIASERNKLNAMYQEGRVTGIPAVG